MQDTGAAGERFGKPIAARGARAVGLLGVGSGAVLLGVHALVLYATERNTVICLLLGAWVLSSGSWILLTGRTLRTPENPPWWIAGYYAVSALGLFAGVYLTFW